VDDSDKEARFEAVVLPHLDAAFNLARWLTRNEHDAEDVVQEAFLRAFRFFEGFRGEHARSWLLSIVRNTTYTWLQQNRKPDLLTHFDDEVHEQEDPAADPNLLLLKGEDHERVRQALDALPIEFREVTVLREMEDLSYKEIAEVTQVPMGTVMSRLARARKHLERALTETLQAEKVK
jgi:RNA polymerase sigma-70 factor (ECF subfamily)